jgi:RNase P/RNase MRP subunit p29
MYDINSIDMIGKNIIVENSSDISKIGIKGKVIFETKNTITIQSNDRILKIKKKELLSLKQNM